MFYRYLFGYQQQIYEKQSSFWAFIETILRQKQVLLIPNWGYFVSAEAGFFAVLEVAFFVVEAGFFAVDFFAAEAGFWVVVFLVVDAALRVGKP